MENRIQVENQSNVLPETNSSGFNCDSRLSTNNQQNITVHISQDHNYQRIYKADYFPSNYPNTTFRSSFGHQVGVSRVVEQNQNLLLSPRCSDSRRFDATMMNTDDRGYITAMTPSSSYPGERSYRAAKETKLPSAQDYIRLPPFNKAFPQADISTYNDRCRPSNNLIELSNIYDTETYSFLSFVMANDVNTMNSTSDESNQSVDIENVDMDTEQQSFQSLSCTERQSSEIRTTEHDGQNDPSSKRQSVVTYSGRSLMESGSSFSVPSDARIAGDKFTSEVREYSLPERFFPAASSTATNNIATTYQCASSPAPVLPQIANYYSTHPAGFSNFRPPPSSYSNDIVEQGNSHRSPHDSIHPPMYSTSYEEQKNDSPWFLLPGAANPPDAGRYMYFPNESIPHSRLGIENEGGLPEWNTTSPSVLSVTDTNSSEHSFTSEGVGNVLDNGMNSSVIRSPRSSFYGEASGSSVLRTETYQEYERREVPMPTSSYHSNIQDHHQGFCCQAPNIFGQDTRHIADNPPHLQPVNNEHINSFEQQCSFTKINNYNAERIYSQRSANVVHTTSAPLYTQATFNNPCSMSFPSTYISGSNKLDNVHSSFQAKQPTVIMRNESNPQVQYPYYFPHIVQTEGDRLPQQNLKDSVSLYESQNNTLREQISDTHSKQVKEMLRKKCQDMFNTKQRKENPENLSRQSTFNTTESEANHRQSVEQSTSIQNYIDERMHEFPELNWPSIYPYSLIPFIGSHILRNPVLETEMQAIDLTVKRPRDSVKRKRSPSDVGAAANMLSNNSGISVPFSSSVKPSIVASSTVFLAKSELETHKNEKEDNVVSTSADAVLSNGESQQTQNEQKKGGISPAMHLVSQAEIPLRVSKRRTNSKERHKPRHYEMERLQIGNFMVKNRVTHNRKITNKLKVMFTKRRFVYQIEGWDCDSDTNPKDQEDEGSDHMACIIVPFWIVRALHCEGDLLQILVAFQPTMFAGQRHRRVGVISCGINFDYKQQVDLTGGQIKTSPLHTILLRKNQAEKLKYHLVNFDSNFEMLMQNKLSFNVSIPENFVLPLQEGDVSVKPPNIVIPPRVNQPRASKSKWISILWPQTAARIADTPDKVPTSVTSSTSSFCASCSCRISCRSVRCTCAKLLKLCGFGENPCNCSNCDNPLNILEGVGIDSASASSDLCLLQNVYKYTDLQAILLKSVRRPCCRQTALLKECIPGIKDCPSPGCEGKLQYSWCQNTLYDIRFIAQNHCNVCVKCRLNTDVHCEHCNKCYSVVKSGSQCPRCKRPVPLLAPTNDSVNRDSAPSNPSPMSKSESSFSNPVTSQMETELPQDQTGNIKDSVQN